MFGLSEIEVIPVAFESLGVRSMCTYIKTPSVRILLDAGVSLGPNRFGLPPHPREYEALRNRRKAIIEFAEKAEVITVSHYHFDHHTPSYIDWAYNWCSPEMAEKIYGGKIVLIKSYKEYVNFSQRRRGWLFTRTSGKHASRLEIADGRSFTFGDTVIFFSKPVFHGPEGSDLGWVIMAVIRHHDECVLFAPDVQGPISQETLNIIIGEKPQLAIIGGPPTYLAEFRVNGASVNVAVKNLETIVRRIPAVILDHHVLRDENWISFMIPVIKAAIDADHRVLTAAEFLGRENLLLEAMRRRLYEDEPPTQEFIKWSRARPDKKKITPPPI